LNLTPILSDANLCPPQETAGSALTSLSKSGSAMSRASGTPTATAKP
jgi:hypothetical protein